MTRKGFSSAAALDDWLHEDVARFVAEVVDSHLDVACFPSATERAGAPHFDPRLMVRILVYGYMIGVRSSRVIERKCVDDACFRWLAAGEAPDYWAIASFRSRHRTALAQLFVQALESCQAAATVRPGRVARDERPRADVPAEEVSALLADAERIDEAEDATSGRDRRGGGLAERLRAPETELAEMCEANAALETAARQLAARRPPGCVGDDDRAAGEGAGTGKARKAQRGLLGALLLALAVAGGYAVAVHKTVTLSVDGVAMTVSTMMRSQVIDVVRDNGFAVGSHDNLSPLANAPVRQSETTVLRRGRPLQVSIDGRPAKQLWTTALTVDEALKALSLTDTAPIAASRASRLPLAGMTLPLVSGKTVHLNDGLSNTSRF